MTVHHLMCAQCGASFNAVRSDAHFCSAACRQDAHRGVPPRQQPRPQPAPPRPPQQEPPPPQEEPPLDPTRRAWLSLDGRRCWFRLNWNPHDPHDVFSNPAIVFLDPTISAHEELGQWWIGSSRIAVDELRRQLRHDCRAEVIELDDGGPLPDLFLLELRSSADPLERAIFALLMATPPERWRTMVKRLAAYAHPDGVGGHRPASADRLLAISYALLDSPDLR